MLEGNSTESIFRFIQMRPARSAEPGETIPLLGDAPLARKLAKTPRNRLRAEATSFLRSAGSITDLTAATPNRKLIEGARSLIANKGIVGNLRSQFAGSDTRRAGQRRDASEFLVAAKFTRVGNPESVRALDILYKALTLLADGQLAADEVKLADVMSRPLVLPFELMARQPAVTGGRGGVATKARDDISAGLPSASGKPQQIYRALRELTSLNRPELIHLDGEPGRTRNVAVPLALNGQGLARLSKESRAVLDSLDLEPAKMPVHDLAAALEASLAGIAVTTLDPGDAMQPLPSTPGDLLNLAAGVRVAGVADLLVVKQHIQKYRRMDIAHIENVLNGEKKSRTHRLLERQEQTFITSTETTHEKETELQTAERFELNQETQRTIKHDQNIGFNLSLSGKYGPTVEFSSQAEAQINTSNEETTRSALTYAKDVMQRSLERVVERVRTEQIRRIVREEEETNLHELKNESGAHIAGVYQYLEKVLRSQVFNYGIRTMFDFMVPEPASYLWHLEHSPATDLALPAPPPKLDAYVASADNITPYNYAGLAALFAARGVEPPPPTYKTAVAAVKHGETGSETGQPRSVMEKEIAVPNGYRPITAVVRPLALTDNALTLGITIGSASTVWKPTGGALTHVGSSHDLGSANLPLYITSASYPYDPQSKLMLHVVAYESNAYSVMANVIFARTEDAYRAWQIKTYDALSAAYQELQIKYEQKVDDLKARAASAAANSAAEFGAAPSQNLKTLTSELKKHCISIITEQWYDIFNATVDADPPFFDFNAAADQGAFIRFFEQAFEWDQLQYICYPYYWARKQTWLDRFRRQDVDPVFLEFLQAGAARVVVPVRPGFEQAVIHYLETTEIWNGMGEPPAINSPLYVPIVNEIKERTGGPQGEIAVGDSWETVLPTPLVILRREDNLPQWERQDPQGWTWEEASTG